MTVPDERRPSYSYFGVNHFFGRDGRNRIQTSQNREHVMGTSLKSATFLMESLVADAAAGDANALYELGVAYSTGTSGTDVDLIEAHKWFNLAALNGSEIGQQCRAEISEEMTAREIAEAQRQARAWLSESWRRAA
jgi:TPR repeat protein